MNGTEQLDSDRGRDDATFRAYDRMTAHDLFIRMGLSKRLVDDFIRPTLLVGLFKPPEELSAAVTMELLYYYALARSTARVPSHSISTPARRLLQHVNRRRRRRRRRRRLTFDTRVSKAASRNHRCL